MMSRRGSRADALVALAVVGLVNVCCASATEVSVPHKMGRSWSGQYLGKYDCEFRAQSSNNLGQGESKENTSSNFLPGLFRRVAGMATALLKRSVEHVDESISSVEENASHESGALIVEKADADEHESGSLVLEKADAAVDVDDRELAQSTVNGPDDMLRAIATMLQQQDELMKTIREIDAQHEAEEEEASWGALDVIAVAETKKSADLETLRGLLDQLQQNQQHLSGRVQSLRGGKSSTPASITPIARTCSYTRQDLSVSK